ncbi:hypothetical protein U6O02_12175, partial [Cutibacterium acnes]
MQGSGNSQGDGGRNIWEEKIADLRRYDLDSLDTHPINPAELSSWPIPDLTFVRVDGILRSWDIEREKQQQQQQPQQSNDPNAVPKRMYLMEDALTGLHSQKTNLAYLALGGKQGVRYYMGISPPAGFESPDGDSAKLSFGTLRSILYSVYNGVDIYKDPFNADAI